MARDLPRCFHFEAGLGIVVTISLITHTAGVIGCVGGYVVLCSCTERSAELARDERSLSELEIGEIVDAAGRLSVYPLLPADFLTSIVRAWKCPGTRRCKDFLATSTRMESGGLVRADRPCRAERIWSAPLHPAATRFVNVSPEDRQKIEAFSI